MNRFDEKSGNEKFNAKWNELEEEGKCDSIGGEEYCRVLSEWLDMGRPSNIADFIYTRANIIGSSGGSPADNN